MVTGVHIRSQRVLPPPGLHMRNVGHKMKQRPLDMPQMTFAERLKFAMRQRGRTAPGLEKHGIGTRQWIYKLTEKDAKPPSVVVQFLALCEELMVRPEWLVREKGPMIPPPSLTDEEAQIVFSYREMDDRGKRELRRVAAAIAQDSDGAASRSNPFKGGKT